MLDPTRATFVKREFRYAKAEDATVKARYPNATKIKIDTHLDEVSASNLAAQYLTETSAHQQAYEVEIAGLWTQDEIVGDISRFQSYFDRFNVAGKMMKLVKHRLQLGRGTTVIVVKG